MRSVLISALCGLLFLLISAQQANACQIWDNPDRMSAFDAVATADVILTALVIDGVKDNDNARGYVRLKPLKISKGDVPAEIKLDGQLQSHWDGLYCGGLPLYNKGEVHFLLLKNDGEIYHRIGGSTWSSEYLSIDGISVSINLLQNFLEI